MLDVGMNGAPTVNYDARGVLSIVVQGALFQGNLIETANHCRHWRELFPKAEIILSVSVTDVIIGETHEGVFTSARLVRKHEHDGHLTAALRIILRSCNFIALSPGELPLPPIKSDSTKLNNANFQIAAAKMGLSIATGRFVLRIRSDMIFSDRSFIEQYEFSLNLPRGESSVFAQRVLVSWLFTLNPFADERLPLHLSDWFHFGLTSDVKRIWDVPLVTLADSIYYRTHKHAEHSNDGERLFNIRLGVEQHIQYHCFKRSFPELTLEYHNDQSSVSLAMGILVDNYAICDLLRANCIFEKYSAEFFDASKRSHCIPREKWISLARGRGLNSLGDVQRDCTSAGSIKLPCITISLSKFKGNSSAENESDLSSVIREDGTGFYTPLNLRTRHIRQQNGNISSCQDGVLFHGPYITLPEGSYVATVKVENSKGRGFATLRVTRDAGGKTIAKRVVRTSQKSTKNLNISFDISAEGASELEVVCSVKGLQEISASGLTIEHAESVVPRPTKWSRSKLFPWV